MKKTFLLILTVPLLSFAEGDPNLVFKSGGASAARVGTGETPCPLCKHKNNIRLNNKNTNALPGASDTSSDTGGVGVGQ